MQLFRLVHADFMKVKHWPLIWMHIIIPCIGFILFLINYSISAAGNFAKIVSFLQTLAIAFPLLIGVVCSMCIDQESQAGNFQVLLTGSIPKCLSFFSKYFFLLVLGLGAALIAVIGYGTGVIGIFHKSPFLFNFYLIAAFILIGSNLFEYIFHLVLSLRYGKGASIGAGIAESLIACLLITDLGDNIWMAVPCSWGIRFVTTWTDFVSKSALTAQNIVATQTSQELQAGVTICIVATALSMMFAGIWFWRWEGRKSED